MTGGDKNSPPHVINPIYALSNQDGTGAKITHVEFTGSNYAEWSKGFRNALGAKRKIGFVNGSVKPPASGSADYEDWYTANCTVIAWIFNTIEPKLRSTISYRDTAYELWEAIRRRFSVGNEVKIYHLYSELASCKQHSNEGVMAYFGRIKKILDDINDYDPLDACECSGCSCGLTAKLQQKREKSQMRSFLMGLEPYFQSVRSQTLGTKPLPSLDEAYSRIIQEEDGRSTAADASPMAFAVRSSGVSGSQPHRQVRKTCTFCKRLGHTEEFCWTKNGYPEGRGPKRVTQRTDAVESSTTAPSRVNAVLGEPAIDANHVRLHGPYLEDEDW